MGLVGLETEYAIRFTPTEGWGGVAFHREGTGARPGNDVVYEAVIAAIGMLVQTQPGERHGSEMDRIFTESGASFSYEVLPTAFDGGLVEGATPECVDAGQLLLYQKANDRLLVTATLHAQVLLSQKGYEGELAFLKNCRDAEGHVYGAQENYETTVAEGLELFLYRAGLVAALPFIGVSAVMVLAYTVLLVTVGVLVMLALLSVVIARPSSPLAATIVEAGSSRRAALMRWLTRWLGPIEKVISYPAWWVGGLPVQLLAFRRQRRAMLGFLISRPAYSGAGTLSRDGAFGLSEKGPSITRVIRSRPGTVDRAAFDTGNLLKDVLGAVHLRWRGFAGLFRARQRMQLGLSDSNMAQTAEYLKVATTALVVEMAEAGYLDDAPQPVAPIEALHTLIADPTLRAQVEIQDRAPMSALALQRFYLEAARGWLKSRVATSLEAHRVLTLWGEVLDTLEKDPGRLVGTLDWPTKRYFIEGACAGEPYEVQKKVDLKYHELDTGYFAVMERRGLARTLVSDHEVGEALRRAPQDGPARMRGQLIKSLQGSKLPVRVSWDSVRVGGRLRGKVIPLRPRKS